MNELSTRPYLVRAIYDWCVDNALTPYLAVRVDQHTRVPSSHVKDGQIVLNLSASAVRNLDIGNDSITCTGRFGGVAFDLLVPIAAVMGIFSKENGHGLMFPADGEPDPPASSPNQLEPQVAASKKSHLKLVK